MHTANNRLLVFARKPAAGTGRWLAYPGTTGLSAIDYRLTDPYLDPPGLFDAFYSEESIRLPDTFWCYDPLTDQPPVNAASRFGERLHHLWLLEQLLQGQRWLFGAVGAGAPGGAAVAAVAAGPAGSGTGARVAKLEQEGIAAGAWSLRKTCRRPEYLKLYQRMDIGLDPVPCNGHTTSLDAFWMGVPTLTLVGKTVVGRAGWSQLCNLGLKELAAETPEQYVALAARLAGDLPRLQELRGTLRQRMLRSPLMDAKRFARHVEQAYRQMWRRWCQQTKAGRSCAWHKLRSEQGRTNALCTWSGLALRSKPQEAEQLYLQILSGRTSALH